MQQHVASILALVSMATRANAQCDNSCGSFASDGDCDDGGPGSEFSMCSRCSDCFDCGARAASSCHVERSESSYSTMFLLPLLFPCCICIAIFQLRARARRRRVEDAALGINSSGHALRPLQGSSQLGGPSQPVVAEPVMGQPVMAQPVMAQHMPVAVAQPVYAQPVVAYAQPVMAQPITQPMGQQQMSR